MNSLPDNILAICLAETHAWGLTLLSAEELLRLVLTDEDLCEDLLEYYEDTPPTSRLMTYEVEELSTIISQELLGEHVPEFQDGLSKNVEFYSRLMAAAKSRGWMA